MAKKPVKQEQIFQKQEEHAIQLGFKEFKNNIAGVDAIHPELPGIEFHLYVTPGAYKDTPEGKQTESVSAHDPERNLFYHVTKDKFKINHPGKELLFKSPAELSILIEILKKAHEMLKKQ